MNCLKKEIKPENLVHNKNDDLHMNSFNTAGKWKSSFSKPLNIHATAEFRVPWIHAAEMLDPESSFNEDEITIE
jgi:hypothetical protein